MFVSKKQDQFSFSKPPILLFGLILTYTSHWRKNDSFQQHLFHWARTTENHSLWLSAPAAFPSGPFGNKLSCHAAIALQFLPPSPHRQWGGSSLLHRVALCECLTYRDVSSAHEPMLPPCKYGLDLTVGYHR